MMVDVVDNQWNPWSYGEKEGRANLRSLTREVSGNWCRGGRAVLFVRIVIAIRLRTGERT